MGIVDNLRERIELELRGRQPTPLQTALSPTEMPTPTDAAAVRASQSAQRTVKKRKGRASTILTGLFGQGGISRPMTALTEDELTLREPDDLGKILLPPGWRPRTPGGGGRPGTRQYQR